VVVAAAPSVEELLAALPPAVRAGLGRSGLAVRCWTGAMSIAALAPALAATLTAGDGALPEGMEPVPAASLLDRGPAEEVDFRPGRALPLRPTSAASLDLDPWFAFHRDGPSPDAARAPVVSLAALELARAAAAAPAWPAAIGPAGGAAPLSEALLAAGDALRPLVPALLTSIGAVGDAGESLLRAGRDVVDGLSGSDAARAATLAAVEAVAASLAGARVEPLLPSTPLRWAVSALADARAAEREECRGRARAAAERLRERLLLDDLGSAAGRTAERLGAALGSAGRFFDPASLAASLAAPAGERLGEERRARILAAAEALDRFAGGEDVVHVVAGSTSPDVPGARTHHHPDPLGAAVGLFEGLAAAAVDVARALRTAELELEDRWDDQRAAALARLDWQGLRPEEGALLPPVLALTDGGRVRAGALGALSALLRSSRPVTVLVLDAEDGDEASDLSRFHAGLGWIGVAHREAAVFESSLADPAALRRGLAALSGAPRPRLLVLRRVDPEAAGGGAVGAALARAGRAWPDLAYDPDAGSSWADRFRLDGNPDVASPWPTVEVAVVDAADQAATFSLPCTFADAVAAEPAFAAHLWALPAEGWDDPALVPLDQFVQDFDADDPARELPWVWTMAPGQVLGRAVVSRALALAARDRARGWRALQELAGYGDVWAERAASAARDEAEASAEAQIQALMAAHDLALQTIADDAVARAMDRLAGSLLGLDAGTLTATPGPSPAAPAPPPAAPPAPAPAAAAPAAPAAAPPPVEDDGLGEPYIDAFLCTTCNECINVNGRLFVYNGDKQAEIADPTAGTFAELVKAAEACPSRCIHPGRPRPGDATATDDLVRRAAAFA
jgi:ferredoxin